ncbi:MAG: hypothetical protein AB2L14_06285 [Candidatus Xenobiia bacterium LiM19]
MVVGFYYPFRTMIPAGGAEVDCVIDTGVNAIPIEIKWILRVTSSDYRGLAQFLKDYSEIAPVGYIITQGGEPEAISDRIRLLPWNYLQRIAAQLFR